MLESEKVKKDFLTWILIGWQLYWQPFRFQVLRSLLDHMYYNMVISE